MGVHDEAQPHHRCARIPKLVLRRPFPEFATRLVPQKEIVDFLLDLAAHDVLNVLGADISEVDENFPEAALGGFVVAQRLLQAVGGEFPGVHE